MPKAYIVSFAYPRPYTGAVFDVYLPEKAKLLNSTTPTLSLVAATLLQWVSSFYSVPRERKRDKLLGETIVTIGDPGGYHCRYLSSLGWGKYLAWSSGRVNLKVTTNRI